jgi:hypothetical protein|uniref:Uncharacterized protein n=1 Tax=viral metagenome TaxID=1070528 RepID=A0A6C0BL04_9ZZZZ
MTSKCVNTSHHLRDPHSHQPHHVHFSEEIVIYQYEETIPCLQETLHDWEECKQHHLQQVYQHLHGNLIGFDFATQCVLADQEDSKYESECIPHEWLVPFGFRGRDDLVDQGDQVEIIFEMIDPDLQEIQLSDDDIEFLIDLGQ